MASREELLRSIQPNMKLNKAFFLKVYADEITYPGSSAEAVEALKAAGCSRAEQYYNAVIDEHEQKRDAELKEVAHWYRQECERQWQQRLREGEKQRAAQTEAELLKRKKQLLIQKLQILKGN